MFRQSRFSLLLFEVRHAAKGAGKKVSFSVLDGRMLVAQARMRLSGLPLTDHPEIVCMNGEGDDLNVPPSPGRVLPPQAWCQGTLFSDG